MSDLAYQDISDDTLFFERCGSEGLKTDSEPGLHYTNERADNAAQYFAEDRQSACPEQMPLHTHQSTNVIRFGDESPVFDRRKLATYPAFIALQKWEGTVTEKMEEYFQARLIDVTEPRPDESVEFDYDEVAEDDLKLVEVGAVFYWSVGYYTTRDGQRLRTSSIRFRRLPAWTPSELDRATERAHGLAKKLRRDAR